MSRLGKHEIQAMLETRSPEVIREQEKERLDPDGLALLAEEERRLLEVEQFAKDWGQQFDEALPPTPDLKLPVETIFPNEDDAPPPVPDASGNHHSHEASATSWWRSSRRVSNPILALAASLILGFAALSWLSFQGYWHTIESRSQHHRTRSGAEDTTPVSDLNEVLYDALLARGKHFLREGQRDKDPKKLREALVDFSEARELKENYDVLTHLAFVYEALGNQKKADELVELALTLDEEK